MKHLRVGTKIGVIIAVLALTGVGIAALGYYEIGLLNERLRRIVEVTAQKSELSWELRLSIQWAVRNERAAILSRDDKESRSFHDVAVKADELLNQSREALAKLLEAHPSAADSRTFDDFERAWKEFYPLHKEALELAVQNTHSKAEALTNGQVHEKIGVIDEALQAVQRQADKEADDARAAKEVGRLSTAAKKGRTCERARRLLLDLHRQLYRHVEAGSDGDRTRADERIAALVRDLGPLMTELAAEDRGGALPDRAAGAFADLKPLVEQVQKLSRLDTDRRAANISLGPEHRALAPCLAALQKLSKGVNDRLKTQMQESQSSSATAQYLMVGVPAVGIPLGVVLALLLTRSITRPMARGVEFSEAIAKGDLTRRLNLGQRDEVGQLTQALDHVAETFAGTLGEVCRTSRGLGGSAAELSTVSHQLLAQSEEMATQAGHVAASSQQASVNINTMAAAAEEMSVNVASISSASEEISVNVGTISTAAGAAAGRVSAVSAAIRGATGAFEAIAADARGGSQTTTKATEMAHQATATMKTLDRAATEINKVTEAIKMIAVQTNLLALNATIEATAAGEAGKGFAVVAHEIKELANQSGRAAEDIAQKIGGVQASTREAVRVIQGVAEVIDQVNTAVGRISAAVEKQMHGMTASAGHLGEASRGVDEIASSIAEVTKGANDMSRNAGEAAQGANDVSRNAQAAARGVQEITSNIQGVSAATRDNTASAQKVKAAADQLRGVAGDLQKIVGEFKVGE